jgi:hypothetical protein
MDFKTIYDKCNLTDSEQQALFESNIKSFGEILRETSIEHIQPPKLMEENSEEQKPNTSIEDPNLGEKTFILN